MSPGRWAPARADGVCVGGGGMMEGQGWRTPAACSGSYSSRRGSCPAQMTILSTASTCVGERARVQVRAGATGAKVRVRATGLGSVRSQFGLPYRLGFSISMASIYRYDV